MPAFFNFSSEPDPEDARRNIADLDQGGLGLPEKDFYFRTDSNSEEIRRKYVAHIAKMLELSGVDESAAHAQATNIMRIETALAKGSLDVTVAPRSQAARSSHFAGRIGSSNRRRFRSMNISGRSTRPSFRPLTYRFRFFKRR